MDASGALIDLFQRWPVGIGPPSVLLPYHIIRLFLKRRRNNATCTQTQRSHSVTSCSIESTRPVSAFSDLPSSQFSAQGELQHACTHLKLHVLQIALCSLHQTVGKACEAVPCQWAARKCISIVYVQGIISRGRLSWEHMMQLSLYFGLQLMHA